MSSKHNPKKRSYEIINLIILFPPINKSELLKEIGKKKITQDKKELGWELISNKSKKKSKP